MTAASDGLKVVWSLPIRGDGQHLGTTIGGCDVDSDHLREIAQATDCLGYYGVRLPTGRTCETPG